MPAKPKIFYLDDEIENLIVFKTVFKKDFDIVTATSAAEAFDLVYRDSFDVIIVDQRMPLVTGVEFLENLQANDPEPIRLLLTGYSDAQSTIDAINRGRIYYYCSKPWVYEELKLILIKGIEFKRLSEYNRRLTFDLTKTVKELDTFLYRASHNLKTPITSQLGLLTLLKMELSDSRVILVDKMEESVSALKSTIQKMEALSSIGTTFLRDFYCINLKELLEEVIEKNSGVIKEKKISLTIEISQSADFFSHKHSISILFDCILDNSINFLKNTDGFAPSISIVAKVDDQTNEFSLNVEDNGIGVSPESLPLVFDPFYRGTTLSNGSGLGLFIVKRICDELHGHVSIASDGVTGTTVVVRLPTAIGV